MSRELEQGLYVFVATFVGFEVIRRVSPLLHTPLMSLTNAISAIAVVGSIVVAGEQKSTLSTVLGTVAVACSTDTQIERVFANLAAVAEGAGLGLDRAVRMTVYLTDLAHLGRVNEIMARHVARPFPARAAVGVASLPRGALFEIDAILHAG